MVPVAVLPPATPFTSQVTTVLVLVEVDEFVRLTTAVNSVVPFSATVAVVGVIATEVTVLVPPEPPPHAVRISAHAITNAKKPRAGALFCIGKLFFSSILVDARKLAPRRQTATPHPALPWKTFVRLGLPEIDLRHPVLAADNCSILAADKKVPEFIPASVNPVAWRKEGGSKPRGPTRKGTHQGPGRQFETADPALRGPAIRGTREEQPRTTLAPPAA